MTKKKDDKKDQEIQKLEEQKQETKESLQRTAAEFDNYRKRTEREKEHSIKYANKDLIQKILPVIDNLELALQNNKKEDEFSKGIEMIYSQLIEVLEEEGVKQIPSENYDPNLHEVVLVDENSEEDGLTILQKGYTLNGKVLRSAKVKISKGDKNE